MVIKIVINTCYGGFSLSKKAQEKYKRLSGKEQVYDFELERDDPFLISIVESMGKDASGLCSYLVIEEIPDDAEGCWSIHEYDGAESIQIDHSYELRKKIAEILYSEEAISESEQLYKIRNIIIPLPSQLKKAKKDILYSDKGPVAQTLAQKYR